ncbi:MAG: deoxyribodipyrimidine photo-lyase [Vampirovibrionales bacterium]|nr:deoxyribodipyrimidine photo-lyase [Vampirovibrionales bacterium]
MIEPCRQEATDLSSQSRGVAIIWLRQCLRLSDNPMLQAALELGLKPVFIYCWSPQEEGDWPPGAASRWWLHHSLQALSDDLKSRGSRLILRVGDSAQILSALIQETAAVALFADARVEPAARLQQATLEKVLLQNFGQKLQMQFFWSNVLSEPGTVLNQQAEPYQVYSPFWRALAPTVELLQNAPQAHALPAVLTSPQAWPKSDALATLKLLPALGWDAAFGHCWQPGEKGAKASLNNFLQNAMARYSSHRDFPAEQGTSSLSAHLHFGEISPRQILHAVVAATTTANTPQYHAGEWIKGDKAETPRASAIKFIKEIGWREFAYHLLWHFPNTVHAPLRAAFQQFQWRADDHQLACWQAGQTGYPIVDAGMRQLWATGWMHNRVRMIVGSFLVKDLRLHWLEGARWFWDTLVDADLASNTMGWQWIAGCGADAAPYFRVFNPWLQSQKFDSQGDYLRRWLPELTSLAAPMIHEPSKYLAFNNLTTHVATHGSTHKMFPARLGAVVSSRYPLPIVDHAVAKAESLDVFKKLKTSG